MNILKLKEYRKKAKLTQFQVSQLLNVTQSHYSRWEKGNRIPDASQILELCKIFDCTPNDLFGIRGVYEVTTKDLD